MAGSVCMCITCVQKPVEVGRGTLDTLAVGVTVSCELPCGC